MAKKIVISLEQSVKFAPLPAPPARRHTRRYARMIRHNKPLFDPDANSLKNHPQLFEYMHEIAETERQTTGASS